MFRSPSTPTSPPVIDAEKNLSIGAIVVYLNQKLPNFPGYVANRVVKKNMAAEKKISRELCLFLNSIGSNQEDISLFHFYPEWDYDNSHRSSDLAVIDVKSYAASNGPAETFFVIEAKRLPTPGKTREREY
ncbi:MAG TPA: hypothetical protein VK622_00405, partial [Puia sp.]|nr:hypothetical protein [Puia sp.]